MKEPCSFCQGDVAMAALCALMPGCSPRKKCLSCTQRGICANKAFHEQPFIAEYFKVEDTRSDLGSWCSAIQVFVLGIEPGMPYAQLEVDLTLEGDRGSIRHLVTLAPEMCPRRTKFMEASVITSRFDNTGGCNVRFSRQLFCT